MNNFYSRILQIIEYYNIENISVFAKKYLKYNSVEKINRLKKENTSPSYQILQDIINRFPSISPIWLLTGKGKMLNSNNNIIANIIGNGNTQLVGTNITSKKSTNPIPENPNPQTLNNLKIEIRKLKDHILKLEGEINAQNQLIQMLINKT